MAFPIAQRILANNSRATVPKSSGRCKVLAQASAAQTSTTTRRIVVKENGAYTLLGTSRKKNEDRWEVKVDGNPSPEPGNPFAFVGVYDGHGGSAVAEWLENNLFGEVQEQWEQGARPEAAITDAFLQADKKLLTRREGFMGLGERGVGGSRCGSTSATAMLYQEKDGSTTLLTANLGDARILLVRNGTAEQLSVDHVPDSEEERLRIERQNPNPKMPLVRYVAGTWRVGGLLALSRAFGDAYMKGSLQFEGIAAGGDGYSSGFGVIAEPYTTLTKLTGSETWLVVASDGLFAEEERGGGGGLDNEQVVSILAAGASSSCAKLAKTLAETAVQVGSTDDVTLVVLRLATA